MASKDKIYGPILSKFRLKRFSRFTFFFLNSLVDIPICFQNIKSLYRPHRSNLVSYFTTILSKEGKYERAMRLVSSSLFYIVNNRSTLPINSYLSFISTLPQNKLKRDLKFTSLSTFQNMAGYKCKIPLKWLGEDYGGKNLPLLRLTSADWSLIESNLKDELLKLEKGEKRVLADFYDDGGDRVGQTLIFEKNKHAQSLLRWYDTYNEHESPIVNVFNMVDFLTRLAQNINPIFSYYVYKTSKTVWKFSRRKAGRFFLMWKYVPPYKRNFIIIRWLKHEFHLQEGRTADERFRRLLLSLIRGEGVTSLIQRKSFILAYVFREHRFSLFSNFRTQK